MKLISFFFYMFVTSATSALTATSAMSAISVNSLRVAPRGLRLDEGLRASLHEFHRAEGLRYNEINLVMEEVWLLWRNTGEYCDLSKPEGYYTKEALNLALKMLDTARFRFGTDAHVDGAFTGAVGLIMDLWGAAWYRRRQV